MTITWKAGKISRLRMMLIFLGIAIPWQIGFAYLLKGVVDMLFLVVR